MYTYVWVLNVVSFFLACSLRAFLAANEIVFFFSSSSYVKLFLWCGYAMTLIIAFCIIIICSKAQIRSQKKLPCCESKIKNWIYGKKINEEKKNFPPRILMSRLFAEKLKLSNAEFIYIAWSYPSFGLIRYSFGSGTGKELIFSFTENNSNEKKALFFKLRQKNWNKISV